MTEKGKDQVQLKTKLESTPQMSKVSKTLFWPPVAPIYIAITECLMMKYRQSNMQREVEFHREKI